MKYSSLFKIYNKLRKTGKNKSVKKKGDIIYTYIYIYK